jgi:hypothetical protein
MKKILTIAILLFSMASYAQGNLQFNQVKTFTGNASGYIVLDTVPTGKIWKIESTGFSGKDNSFLQINNIRYVNFYTNFLLYYPPGSGNANTSSQSSTSIKETIWLKSGDILGWENGSYVITLIEYNIVQ